MSAARSIRWRASPPKRTSLAAMWLLLVCLHERTGLDGLLRALALDDAHDVGLLHDQEFLAIELHLGAGPLAEQHAVAGLYVERLDLPLFVARTRADRDHLALHRLLLGGVRDDDPARGLLFGSDAPHHDAVVQRTEFHWDRPLSGCLADRLRHEFTVSVVRHRHGFSPLPGVSLRGRPS